VDFSSKRNGISLGHSVKPIWIMAYFATNYNFKKLQGPLQGLAKATILLDTNGGFL